MKKELKNIIKEEILKEIQVSSLLSQRVDNHFKVLHHDLSEAEKSWKILSKTRDAKDVQTFRHYIKTLMADAKKLDDII